MSMLPPESAGAPDQLHVGRYSIGTWSPLKWALMLLVLVCLDGLVGLAVGVVIGVELLLVGSPRRLLALSLPCFAAVILQDLLRGLPSEATVAAAWVLSNKLGNHLAFAGFAFLTCGLVLPERLRRVHIAEAPTVRPTHPDLTAPDMASPDPASAEPSTPDAASPDPGPAQDAGS